MLFDAFRQAADVADIAARRSPTRMVATGVIGGLASWEVVMTAIPSRRAAAAGDSRRSP